MTSDLHPLTLHADIRVIFTVEINHSCFLPCPGEDSGIDNWKTSQEKCVMLVNELLNLLKNNYQRFVMNRQLY